MAIVSNWQCKITVASFKIIPPKNNELGTQQTEILAPFIPLRQHLSFPQISVFEFLLWRLCSNYRGNTVQTLFSHSAFNEGKSEHISREIKGNWSKDNI